MARWRGNYEDKYTKDEVQSLIMPLHLKGVPEQKILDQIQNDLGLRLPMVALRNEIRQAKKDGRCRYEPGRDGTLALDINEVLQRRGRKLERIEVVSTTRPVDVARVGAEVLCDVIRDLFVYDSNRTKVDIGFAGGRTPSLMAQALSERLADFDRWPKDITDRNPKPTIVFHSLVGNMNPHSPEADPNAFLIYLTAMGDEAHETPFGVRFNCMPAPGIVTHEEYLRLTGQDDGPGFALIQAALRRGDDLDFIVTSCAHWGPGHRSIRGYIGEACEGDEKLKAFWAETIRELDEQGVIGDVMWWPISRSSSEIKSTLRVMTMMSLADLIRFANPEASAGSRMGSRRRWVLLLAGPCSGPGCRDSKGELLASILGMRYPPVTHLVADSRSARDCKKIL